MRRPSVWEAADGLKHLGIKVNFSENKLIEKEFFLVGWLAHGQISGRRLTRVVLEDMRDFIWGNGIMV